MRECPFCGFDEGWINETSYKSPMIYKVACKICGASGPEAKSRDMAERKWDGLLSEIESESKFKEALKEEMGGVSAPMATLVNTPGVGTSVPASTAAMTGAQQYDQSAIGSGDKWGGGKETKKKRRKISQKKHKVSSYEQYAAKFPLGKAVRQK